MKPGQQRKTKGHIEKHRDKHIGLSGKRSPTGVGGWGPAPKGSLGAEKWVGGRRGDGSVAKPEAVVETRWALHLISWVALSAFWVLKTSVSCSSRCLSCSHVESLLQRKDRGHRWNTLRGSQETCTLSWGSLSAKERGPPRLVLSPGSAQALKVPEH